ncbi:MAG: hypothetical protein O2887_07740 [Bacteroidetes bacterium]|nr:hypothetical protein [Bacteroidota bacterium]MDA1120372.1 hypothetical protein [Bacteroidota bacterium]
MRNHFQLVTEDNRSGSVKILENLIDAIRETSKEIDAATLMAAVEGVCHAHNNLMVLQKFSDNFKEFSYQNPSPEEIFNWLKKYQEKWGKVNQQIAAKLWELFDFSRASILLHSSSKTIVDVIAIMIKSGISPVIFQTESRPMFEGREQALALSALKCKVTMIVDAAVSSIIPDIDVVLLGADQFDNTNFMNKVGSLNICLGAHRLGKPVFVLADERKRVDEVVVKNDYPKNELWDDAPAEIDINNLYFEKVNMDLITGLIS